MRGLSLIIYSLTLLFSFLHSQSKNVTVQSVILDQAFNAFDKDEIVDAAQLVNLYDPKRVQDYASKIEIYLQQQGYLYARVNKIEVIYNSDSTAVDVKILGNPGSLVSFGNITITSDSIDAVLYRNLLNIQKYDPYRQELLENDINQMLAIAADSGFVYAKAQIKNAEIESDDGDLLANIAIEIHEGEIIAIDDILISGNHYTRNNVILRELPVQKGEKYSRSAVERIPQRLMRIGIFMDVKPPSMLLNDNGRYILSLNVEEGNATTFDGIVGYIPETQNTSTGNKSSGYFTGLVDLTFNNLFGTARKFDIHWEKPDKDSENFFFRYTEPWIFDYPLDVSLGLERTVRDSTYIEWKGQMQGKWRFSENLSIVSGFERQVVLPDSVSNRDLRLVRYEQNNFELGVEYDTRDYPINPRSGIFIGHSYTFGLKNNFGPGYLLREDSIKTSEQIELIKLNFKWYKEFFRNQVFALQLNANVVNSDRLQITDLIWFGGARTLRGYRENQFRGNVAAWLNLEYRFLLSRNSRVFLFNDWGAYQNKITNINNEFLPGYGIGIRLDTALGIMAVDFGLGKGDGFSDAKIHFGIVNRF